MKAVTADAQAVQRHRVTILECVKVFDSFSLLLLLIQCQIWVFATREVITGFFASGFRCFNSEKSPWTCLCSGEWNQCEAPNERASRSSWSQWSRFQGGPYYQNLLNSFKVSLGGSQYHSFFIAHGTFLPFVFFFMFSGGGKTKLELIVY